MLVVWSGLLFPAAVTAVVLLLVRSGEVEIRQHQMRVVSDVSGPNEGAEAAVAAAEKPASAATTTQWSFRRASPDRQLRFELQGIPKAFSACNKALSPLCTAVVGAPDLFGGGGPSGPPPPASLASGRTVGGDLLRPPATWGCSR